MAKSKLRSIEWYINHYFLQGVREFRVVNPDIGDVEISYEDDRGEWRLLWEDALSKYVTEFGRLIRMDLRPATKRPALNIGAMRDASISQVVLDDLVSPRTHNPLKRAIVNSALQCGTFGLATYEQAVPEIGKRPVAEYVHPSEILFMPHNPISVSNIRCTMRHRWVDLDWIKSQPNIRQRVTEKDLEPTWVPYGEYPTDYQRDSSNVPTGAGNEDETQYGIGPKNLGRNMVRLTEVFVHGAEGSVARYVVKAGHAIVHDTDYEGEGLLVPMPLNVGRYADIDAPYGRSFMGPLVPMNERIESVMSTLFANVEDLDNFGILLIPQGMGISERDLEFKSRHKFLMYSPDYTEARIKPDSIVPTNTGDFPAKVAEVGIGMMDRLANQVDLAADKGRIDSAAGLGYMYEASTVPLSGPTNSIADCFSAGYASMLYIAKALVNEGSQIRLKTIDDSVAGIILDPRAGTMTLGSNPVPDWWRVEIDVRDRLPKLQQQEKNELWQMYQGQLITPREFIWEAFERGLSLPLGNKAAIANYEKAKLNNIVLFGDGTTPGKIDWNPETDIVEIHLEVLQAFMSQPFFMLADPAVRKAFMEYKWAIMGKTPNFPGDLNYPEDAAAQEQKIRAQAEKMMGQAQAPATAGVMA